jgi:hypothetical protein
MIRRAEHSEAGEIARIIEPSTSPAFKRPIRIVRMAKPL